MRLEAIASGGYFPTPPHIISHIARLLDTADHAGYVLMDPCAGEGRAIADLARQAFAGSLSTLSVYTCELEKTRFQTLEQTIKDLRCHWRSPMATLQGDAFQIAFEKPVGDLLYLNPPYDLDPVHGRLEQRFLDRFQSALVVGGVLVFVVPFYALKASAKTLATQFTDLVCFRFPDEDFDAYKQVVLFGVKGETQLRSDPKLLRKVETWAESVELMPVLGEPTKVLFTPPQTGGYHVIDWRMRDFDRLGLMRKIRPWQQSARVGGLSAVPHIMPTLPLSELMFRTYQLATPPRPAHIAAGIASGLFNGRRVAPITQGLPDLLVKGVFDRDFVTVEEKTNKSGEVTSVTQVQQPKLVTTILDLKTKKYTTLTKLGKTSSLDVEQMSIEDLLEHYGPSLMQVMLQQCPVLYDPKRDADRVQLKPTARPLFSAQQHTAKALIMLLGGNQCKNRRFKNGKLLGEIGSGKTSVALAVSQTIAHRTLVICPPHLLASWRKETALNLPDAEVRVLADLQDLDDLSTVPADKQLIAIMSREAAKLGHGWASVEGSCPKCGAPLPKEDIVKKRLTCQHQGIVIKGRLGFEAEKLAVRLMSYSPDNHQVRTMLPSRHSQRILDQLQKVEPKPEWRFESEWVEALLPKVYSRLLKDPEDANLLKLFGRLMLADYNPERIARMVRQLAADSGESYALSDAARSLVMLLEQGSDLQLSFEQDDTFRNASWASLYSSTKQSWGYTCRLGKITWVDGKLQLDGLEPNSLTLAEAILRKLIVAGKVSSLPACEGRLYQAVPEPRRVALANHLAKYRPNFFDLLLLDESHEYSSDSSAQGMAAHRLTGLGIPSILMTGSAMNGYATSLYQNMWAVSPSFRQEFGRADKQRFVDRYGYRKRVLSDKDRETGEVVAFGAVSDRVQRNERTAGDAPGILPLFLFRHLLPIAVTLHKADLAIDIPPCRVEKHAVEASAELLGSYKDLLSALKQQIKKDQFQPDLSGKLFGQLSELPSYLDRSSADVGNNAEGMYEIRYPESVGGELVATGKQFPAEMLSAKEEKMLELLKAELAEGRNAMVFGWHTNLLQRISRLIEQHLGVKAPVLYADAVPPGKRQAWIEKQIVSKQARVLVANPQGISTGLNVLTYFSTEIWMENPQCSPHIFRQAVGRVDRVGQKLDTRIHFLVYMDSLQQQLYDLLMRKVEVAVSTDGLDNESMLAAAGVGTQHYSGMSIGRQLWALINEE